MPSVYLGGPGYRDVPVTDLPPEPSQFSVASGDLWTDQRQRIYEALGTQSSLFAELYRRAIEALNERPLTPGAVVVAGHCIRDMANGLPDVIGDAGEIPAYVPISGLTTDLAKRWEEFQSQIGSMHTPIPVVVTPNGPEPVVAMPSVVAEAARRVAAGSRTATENSKRRRSALAIGRQETEFEASVRVFDKSVRVFEGVRHPGRGREFELDKIVVRISEALPIIEATLEARLGRFFASVENLMDVVDAANRRVGGGS